jgi:hypothetical protein
MTNLLLYTESKRKYYYETKVAKSKRKRKRLESEKQDKKETIVCSKCDREGHKDSRSKEYEYHNRTINEMIVEKLGDSFE